MPALAEAKRDADIIQQITNAIRNKDEQAHLRPGPHTCGIPNTRRSHQHKPQPRRALLER
ncbi:hypothetical protein JB92DRAFT_2965678, partial [Gautieria morchelliformis]